MFGLSALAIAGPQNQAPPCSDRGAILQLAYNANANVPSINADNGCIQTLSHMGFSTSYRTVDLRIRQATGSFSNAIQYSFDGVKFNTLGWVDMTVKEGKFLASLRVLVVTTGGATRTVHYQVIGRLANSSYLNPIRSYPLPLLVWILPFTMSGLVLRPTRSVQWLPVLNTI